MLTLSNIDSMIIIKIQKVKGNEYSKKITTNCEESGCYAKLGRQAFNG